MNYGVTYFEEKIRVDLPEQRITCKLLILKIYYKMKSKVIMASLIEGHLHIASEIGEKN